MSFLSPFISKDRTVNKASLKSQKRIFEVLSNLLHTPDDEISSDLIYQKLFDRERIGSTAIGKGVAVPHCRIAGIMVTRLAILTLDVPIEYEMTNEPVDIFIAAIFPESVKDVHIAFMGELVKFLKKKGTLTNIRQAQSNEQLYQLFLSASDVTP
ncbi:PTS sugar transporter subunit IIA [Facilibium subflavum]|uniref:PTS sugar transporter subunit IIA n=1 Tax=Facilibium subflavum TaxID=2219058 RepID=UPI000E64AF8B|nr:PTS sugar transporter subunit IIA [Facilibium subflavum]